MGNDLLRGSQIRLSRNCTVLPYLDISSVSKLDQVELPVG